MKKTGKLIPGLLLLALMAPPVMAQEEAAADGVESLRKEIQQLKAGQAAMRRQLVEIQKLVQQGGGAKRPPANTVPDVTLDLKGFPFKGDVNAAITVVEFSDFK